LPKCSASVATVAMNSAMRRVSRALPPTLSMFPRGQRLGVARLGVEAEVPPRRVRRAHLEAHLAAPSHDARGVDVEALPAVGVAHRALVDGLVVEEDTELHGAVGVLAREVVVQAGVAGDAAAERDVVPREV